jgi:hypothetical protein
MTRLAAFLAPAALALAGCATAQPDPASPLEAQLAWLTGSWSNAAQYAAAPEALKREPAPGHPYDWLDLQYAEFHRVDAPGLGEHVIYLEWRSGAADGPISRQRLWVFHADEDGAPAGMDFYTMRDPGPYAGRGAEPGAFTDLNEADLVGYPDGCTLQPILPASRGILFQADPEDCTITARSGREMGIRADITLAPGRLSYSEAGILESGRYAFLVPGGEQLAYAFRPE